MIFDCMYFGKSIVNTTFVSRLFALRSLKLPLNINLVQFYSMKTEHIENYKKEVVAQGYEGLYLKSNTHIYTEDKKTNKGIKDKDRITADLVCVDVVFYNNGLIKTIILEDDLGRIANVRSGMMKFDREQTKKYYIGRVVEIEYERITDVYIQAVFKTIRFDKDVV